MIRRARPGDTLAVRKLIRELGYEPSNPRMADETIAQVIRHPEAAVFVAVEGIEVLGYVALTHRPQMRLGGRLASIDELVVTESHRGRGVGRRLLAAALSHARGLCCRRIEVHQRRSRESYARAFYRKAGFVEVDSAVLRFEFAG